MRILEDRASAMGRSIRTLRERRNLTQKELAELSGLSESSLRSYELGARYPKIDSITKISLHYIRAPHRCPTSHTRRRGGGLPMWEVEEGRWCASDVI